MVNAGFSDEDTLAQGATIDAVTSTVAAWSWECTLTGDGNLIPGDEVQPPMDKAAM
jgi:hypothetical protein